MKLMTRLALLGVSDEYYRKYLREYLDKGELDDSQIRYLISNLNDSDYIRQNLIPVAEALRKGISIEAIEECASMLKDASDQSIFANESDRGKLFNKVPDDLHHLLKLSDVKDLFYDMKLTKRNELTDQKANLKEYINLLYECRNLGSVGVLEESDFFWDMTARNKWIDNVNCDALKNYNNFLKQYAENNQEKVQDFPTAKELLDMGLSKYNLMVINYNDFLSLHKVVDKYKEDLLNSDTLNELKITFSDDFPYDLSIEKCINVKLVNDYDIGAREEPFTDLLIVFKNKNDPENDFIGINDKNFMKMFIASSFVSNREVVPVYTQEYEAEIQQKIERYSLGKFNISEMMKDVSYNAFYGKEPDQISLTDGKNTIQIVGYIYEPIYEDFSADAYVILNNENVSNQFENIEDTIQYIRENINIEKLAIVHDKSEDLNVEEKLPKFSKSIKELKDTAKKKIELDKKITPNKEKQNLGKEL